MINGDDNQTNDKGKQNLELHTYNKNLSFKWEKLELDSEYTFLTGGSLIFNYGITTLICKRTYI